MTLSWKRQNAKRMLITLEIALVSLDAGRNNEWRCVHLKWMRIDESLVFYHGFFAQPVNLCVVIFRWLNANLPPNHYSDITQARFQLIFFFLHRTIRWLLIRQYISIQNQMDTISPNYIQTHGPMSKQDKMDSGQHLSIEYSLS